MSSESSDADSNSGGESRAKKSKRLCKYREEWSSCFSWVRPCKDNIFKAHCILCKRDFMISNGGLSNLKQHDRGTEHQNKIRITKTSKTIGHFFGTQSNSPSSCAHIKKVAAAELTNVYHNVVHGHSMLSLDCTSKLSSIVYPDSKIAGDMQLGRTKATKIACSVLAPLSITPAVKQLVDHDIFYSIGTDASNHGNIKMYPLVIRYFTLDDGLKNYLLDFYEDAKETANDIFVNLKKKLLEYNLKIENITSYSADSANVNFGRFNSVYTRLKNENDNILEARCLAHLVHNTVKYAIGKMEFDIESFVTKTFTYFSSHAKRTSELKEFFEFVDIEYAPLLKHVPTRWLSLQPAINRLYKNLPAVQAYFLSASDVSNHILKYYTTNIAGTDLLEAELYLSFFHNTLIIFEDAVRQLEGASVLICDVYKIMNSLKQKIGQRIEDVFFGMAVQQTLQKVPTSMAEKYTTIFLEWYRNVLTYLEVRFDFSENSNFYCLQPLTLTKELKYQDLCNIVSKLQIPSINLDALYEEYCTFKPLLMKIIEEKKCENVLETWIQILKSTTENKYLIKIIQYIFSVPVSNAQAERIFSLCMNTWTKNRNKLDIDTVKAELQIKSNFNLQCKDFYKFIIENEEALKAAKSNTKYIVKK